MGKIGGTEEAVGLTNYKLKPDNIPENEDLKAEKASHMHDQGTRQSSYFQMQCN
jgi:hypothetical protein